ncbi:hypothetical protein D3C80_958700 [compost metagenome]
MQYRTARDGFLIGALAVLDDVRNVPARFLGTFHLHEVDVAVGDDIDIVRDLTPDTADGFVTEHPSDMESGDTVLEKETMLGGYTARIV